MKIGEYEIQVPFVTTAADSVKTVVELADIELGEKVVDLGSGDGRMVLAFTRAGAQVTGYEIKEPLVIKSRIKLKEAGFSSDIRHESFWDVDLSPFSIVYVYGMQSILGRLEKKLEKELYPGTKVISNIFRFPHWKVKKEKNHVHLYIK